MEREGDVEGERRGMNCPRWDRFAMEEEKSGKVKNNKRPRRTKAKSAAQRSRSPLGMQIGGRRGGKEEPRLASPAACVKHRTLVAGYAQFLVVTYCTTVRTVAINYGQFH